MNIVLWTAALAVHRSDDAATGAPRLSHTGRRDPDTHRSRPPRADRCRLPRRRRRSPRTRRPGHRREPDHRTSGRASLAPARGRDRPAQRTAHRRPTQSRSLDQLRTQGRAHGVHGRGRLGLRGWARSDIVPARRLHRLGPVLVIAASTFAAARPGACSCGSAASHPAGCTACCVRPRRAPGTEPRC